MKTRVTLVVAGFAALLLGACDKRPSNVPVPVMERATVNTGSAAQPAGSTSVPPADTVVAPAGDVHKGAATAGRANQSMTRAEESAAMPMAGQNNDHSAPVAPAKRASSP